MSFDTLNLGQIFQTAEAIKGMKRQGETDKLRDAYLNTQLQGAQQQQKFAAQDQQAQMDATTARQHFLANQAIETAPDPKAAVMQFAPEIPQQYDQAHGQGSFDLLHPEEIKSLARYAKEKAAAAAGINTQPDANVVAQQGFQEKQQGRLFDQQRELAKEQHGYRLGEIGATNAANRQHVPAGYRSKQDGSLEFIPGGPADPSVATNQRTLRPIPATAAQGIIENRTSLKQIERALQAVTQNPEAFGLQNLAPDALTQRVGGKAFSGGTGPRAQVADIGSLKIHDRSGAAVTASEFPRLKPFIPQATDKPEIVKTKLENLRANLESMQEEIEAFYTPDAGYRPIPGPSQNSQQGPVQIKGDADYAQLPSGTQYVAPDGSTRTKR